MLLRKILVWCVLAVVAGILLVFALPSYRQGEASIAGKTPENFALELNGKQTQLTDFRGKVVVLNFWASWCPPCVEETPALNALQKQIEGRGGFVLGVDVDEDPAKYEQFVQDYHIIFPTWRDPTVQGLKWKIANDYGTTVIPETYIIGRNGKIARKIIGPQQWDSPEMKAYFDALLKE
jgi:thiol-disulfide isomerase/thioredoxin